MPTLNPTVRQVLTNVTSAPTTSVSYEYSLQQYDTRTKSFQVDLTGTGAVTATVKILASNTDVNYGEVASIDMSGTNLVTALYEVAANYAFLKLQVTAISGTGAVVNAWVRV